MSLKLLSVIKKDSEYEVKFEQDGQSKSLLITESLHWIEEIQQFLSTIASENNEFYEIWKDSEFRNDVSQSIKKLKAAELQAA